MFQAVDDKIIVKPDHEYWKIDRPRWDADGRRLLYPLETGTVVSIGPGEWDSQNEDYKPMPCDEGDLVYFDPGDAQTFLFQDEVFALLNSYDIVGVA